MYNMCGCEVGSLAHKQGANVSLLVMVRDVLVSPWLCLVLQQTALAACNAFLMHNAEWPAVVGMCC
jgi:hypothetical protein